jgi:SAM-dependent methyltransferase
MFWIILMLTASPATAVEPVVTQESLDRIQHECLRAYPPEMLALMASGAEKIPEEVEEDPTAQMQFLDKELTVEKGLFYPILLEDVLAGFTGYVKPGTQFLDLGSGDGRVLFLASLLGAHATGMEYDKSLVATSQRALLALEGLIDPSRIKVIEGDFFESSWSGYDMIYYFDQSSFEPDRVRAKLQRELDPGAVLLVAFEQSPFPGLTLEEATGDFKVYRQPAASTPP